MTEHKPEAARSIGETRAVPRELRAPAALVARLRWRRAVHALGRDAWSQRHGLPARDTWTGVRAVVARAAQRWVVAFALLLVPARGEADATRGGDLRPLVALLERGEYATAEAGLRARVAEDPAARLHLGRLLLETGRYAGAREQAHLALAQLGGQAAQAAQSPQTAAAAGTPPARGAVAAGTAPSPPTAAAAGTPPARGAAAAGTAPPLAVGARPDGATVPTRAAPPTTSAQVPPTEPARPPAATPAQPPPSAARAAPPATPAQPPLTEPAQPPPSAARAAPPATPAQLPPTAARSGVQSPTASTPLAPAGQPGPATQPAPTVAALAAARDASPLAAAQADLHGQPPPTAARPIQRLQAEAYTLEAEAWLAEGRYTEAEQALRKATIEPTALRARMVLGRLLLDRGRQSEAHLVLDSLRTDYDRAAFDPDRSANLTYLAIAARALGRMHEANDTFREAALADPNRVETQLEWAQLFLDKYDPKHAAESVLAALARNKHSALAHVLMARLALLQALDFAQAEAAISRALAENPQLTAAYVTRAGMALRNIDIAGAEHACSQALAINPVDLDALSVRAAVRFLDDDAPGYAAQERAVLALNPHFSRFYSIVGEYAEWEHRYPEIVSMTKRALAIDPEDAQARAALGLNLLRMGDETRGLAELRKAWERDRFNVLVYNTLNLYDEAIRPDYRDFTAKPFQIRLHKTERPVLEPYLVPMLQQAYADMRKRYAFTPEGPLRIELYADRAQFSVRTTGLPNAGVQGVCFGKVVTGLSPRGGPFNWGQIVWHELSHVFHLQLSKNHVPRWFTEGLAEYETVIARPEWKREDDYSLWKAMRADRLPPLAAMNQAFTHAQKSEDLMTAYYLAFRAVQYIVDRFGFARMRPMLVAFGQGQKTEQVVQNVLGISLDELDTAFRAHLAERLAKYDHEFTLDFASFADLPKARALAEQSPTNADAQAALAMAEVLADHFDAGARAAKTALKLSHNHRVAHFALARVALAKRDAQRAERCLMGIVRSGVDGYLLRMMLARGAMARSSPRDALSQLEAATQLDADRPEAWKLMLEVATQLGDGALGLRAVAAMANLDQHDGVMHAAYLALLAKTGAWAEVVREGETALYIDPENPSLHLHLGQGYVHTGAAERGLVELGRALSLGYAKPAIVHMARARAYLALRNPDSAKREIQSALEQDPAVGLEAQQLLAP